MAKTAAALIIGNEILSGKVRDENGPFLIEQLRRLGVELRHMSVIPDEPDPIARALTAVHRECDLVFTSGGVGPTHDDVTVRSVAKALGRQVVRAPELEALVRRHFGESPTPEAFRFAEVPEGAVLIRSGGTLYPLICVDRVYLFPGVPDLFRRQFLGLSEHLRDEPFHLRCIYLSEEEIGIAAALDRVAAAHPRVSIGSYPRFDAAGYKVKLTVESRSQADVDQAFQALLAALPAGSIVRTE